MVPFFKAGGRVTAGDVHFVEQPSTATATGVDVDADVALVPAGETEFARDKAFGYRSSNLVDWIREKAAAAAAVEGGQNKPAAATEQVVSVSLEDLREGGPKVVRQRLTEAKGGCVVVNAVEERDLQVRRAFDPRQICYANLSSRIKTGRCWLCSLVTKLACFFGFVVFSRV